MKNNLKLYAIFDQHNGLDSDQRKQFPFYLLESFLPKSVDFKGLTVISASANNEYHLKVAAKGEWPQFIMNEGYSDEEWEVKNIRE